MKNTFKSVMLMFVAAATLFAASCSKDEDGVANAPESVADTEWSWSEEGEDLTGIIDVSVEFNGPALASLSYTDMSTGIMQSDVLIGRYSYADGKGTMSLEDSDWNTVSIGFTVSGSTLSLRFKGTDYVLTKR